MSLSFGKLRENQTNIKGLLKLPFSDYESVGRVFESPWARQKFGEDFSYTAFLPLIRSLFHGMNDTCAHDVKNLPFEFQGKKKTHRAHRRHFGGCAGMIPKDLSEKLQRMARIRNLLVHMHWKADYAPFYEPIQLHLVNFHLFYQAIVALL